MRENVARTQLPVSLVSIIIPLYNSEQFLAETLTSVSAQLTGDWECLIVDDGSSDKSMQIATAWSQKDPRFRCYTQPNSGPSAARNRGLVYAKGDYVLFLDSDDYLLPAFLSELLVAYNQSQKPGTVFFSEMYIGRSENINDYRLPALKAAPLSEIDFQAMYSFFNDRFKIIPACVLFPAGFLKGQIWDAQIRNSEDWDFYLNLMLKNGCTFKSVGQRLVIYRNSDNSLSKNFIATYKGNYLILGRYAPEGGYGNYIKKAARIVSKNQLQILFGKTRRLVVPGTATVRLFLMNALIFPLSFYFSLRTILIKK